MTNEEFNTKLNSRFETILPTVNEVTSQLFKREFGMDHTVIGSGAPLADVQNDAFPKVSISFKANVGYDVFHIFTLPNDLVLNLYAWMIDMEPDAEVTDEHLEGLKEGVDQVLGQIRAVLDGEGVAFEVSDLKLSITADPSTLGLEMLPADGSAMSYSVTADGNSFSVNHYVFVDYSSMSASEAGGISDEDIDKMLNGDELDARIRVDDDLMGEDVNVKEVEFGDFNNASGGPTNGKPRNIDMLLDVDLEVLVELGRKTMLIKDVLKLGKGSVVELDKAAGEPLGIFVNGRKLAEGEVVVIDDHFGIRITQLAGTAERIKSLG